MRAKYLLESAGRADEKAGVDRSAGRADYLVESAGQISWVDEKSGVYWRGHICLIRQGGQMERLVWIGGAGEIFTKFGGADEMTGVDRQAGGLFSRIGGVDQLGHQIK